MSSVVLNMLLKHLLVGELYDLEQEVNICLCWRRVDSELFGTEKPGSKYIDSMAVDEKKLEYNS